MIGANEIVCGFETLLTEMSQKESLELRWERQTIAYFDSKEISMMLFVMFPSM